MTAETRSVRVRVSADVSDLVRGYQQAGREGDAAMGKLATGADRAKASVVGLEGEVTGLSDGVRRSGREIDVLSGRLSIARDAILTLGTTAVPLAAGLAPALSGTAMQLGVVAGAAGVSVLAFQGVGDAIDALNDFQLEPTEENLSALRLEMERIGPAGAQFVRYLDSLGPQLRQVQDAAREGLLPGVEDGIDEALRLLPQVQQIVSDIATTLGSIAGDAGANLAGPDFAAFFDYLDREAGPLLDQFLRSVGNVTVGLANIVVGLEPLTSSYSLGLQEMTESFAEWSRGLENNAGFQEFLSYVQQSGPQTIDLLRSIGQAVVGLVQATAPVGSAVLPILTELADAFATIASSPIGTPLLTAAAAMATLNRSAQLVTGTMNALAVSSGRAQTSLTGLAPAANLAAMLVGMEAIDAAVESVFQKDFDDSSLQRNLEALANGRTVSDLDEIGQKLSNINNGVLGFTSLDFLPGDSFMEEERAQIEKLDQALAGLVESGNADRAAAAFSQIRQQGADAGVSAKEVSAAFDAYATALDNVEAAGSGDFMSGFIGQMLAGADAARGETRALEDNIRSMLRKRDVALGAFDAETRWRQALVSARQAARANSAGIRGNSEAALENRARLGELASAWNNQSAAVRNSSSRFRAARSAFIETAVAMGVPRGQARALARELLAIPKSRVAKVRVDADVQQARAEINGVYADLLSLNGKTATTYVNTVRTGPAPGFEGFARNADGGTVPRTGLPYADRHPYLLADGEEVVSNRHGQADRHRPLLKAINAGRLADGGTTGKPAPGAPSSRYWGDNGDKDRLLLSELRQILGSFDLSVDMSAKDVREEFIQLSKSIRESGGVVSAQLSELAARSVKVTRELQRSTRELEKERDQRRELRQEAAQYRGEIRSSFDNDPFGNGLAGLRLQLEADRNDAQAMLAAARRADRKGLSGGLEKAALASGDLTTLQQLARSSRGEIAGLNALFGQTDQARNALAAFGSNEVYGASLRGSDRTVAKLERTVDRLEKRLKTLDKSVEAGARAGTSKGMTERGRTTAQRTKAGGR